VRVPPLANRMHLLTDEQACTIEVLLQAKQQASPLALVGEAGCGRVFTVCGFFESIHHLRESRMPSLVLVDPTHAWVWVKVLRELTSFAWIEYNGDPPTRTAIRAQALRGVPRFDVLLTTPEIVVHDWKYLRGIPWDHSVVDLVHGDIGPCCELPGMTVYLSPQALPRVRTVAVTAPLLRHTETVVLVQNCAAPLIAARLRALFRGRAGRAAAVRLAPFLVRETAFVYIHPFLVPRLERQILAEIRGRLGIPPAAAVPDEQIREALRARSDKLGKLAQMVNRGTVTLVVADYFAQLRLVHRLCGLIGVPCGMLESPVHAERMRLPFTDGVVLMTRDFSSPALTAIRCDALFFLDIGRSAEADHNLIAAVTHGRRFPVYRLLTADSMEIPLYKQFLSPAKLNFERLEPTDAELFLRMAAVTPQSPSTSEPAQSSEIEIDTAAADQPDLPGDFRADAVRADDFWDTAFGAPPKPAPPKPTPPAQPRPSKPKPAAPAASPSPQIRQRAIFFLERLMIVGVGAWGRLAEDMNRPVDDVSAFGHAIVIFLLAQASEIPPLLNAIAMADLFPPEFSPPPERLPALWRRLAQENPLPAGTGIEHELEGRHARCIGDLEAIWVLRMFVTLRCPDYLPPRYPSRVTAALSQPEFAWKLIRAVLERGLRWRDVIGIMHLEPSEQAVVEEEFRRLLRAIIADILSHVVHAPNQDELMRSSTLRPFVAMLRNGPWTPRWSPDEVNALCGAVSEWFIPLDTERRRSFGELWALADVRTKTVGMVESFALRLLKACATASEEAESVPVDGRSVPVGPAAQADLIMLPTKDMLQLRNRSYTMQHVVAVNAEGVHSWRAQAEIPETWTIECDRALISGLARLGCSSLPILWATEPQLRPYELIFANSRLPLARLRLIVTLNHPKRSQAVLGVGITKITMTYNPRPTPPLQPSSIAKQVRLAGKVDPEKAPMGQSEQVASKTNAMEAPLFDSELFDLFGHGLSEAPAQCTAGVFQGEIPALSIPVLPARQRDGMKMTEKRQAARPVEADGRRPQTRPRAARPRTVAFFFPNLPHRIKFVC
jgi:hypothetical protein